MTHWLNYFVYVSWNIDILKLMENYTSEAHPPTVVPTADKCIYTSCYCEENVWQLCNHLRKINPEEIHTYFVVFISNQNKTVPLWCQKASTDESGFVIWDYHVILVNKSQKSWVYDLDSSLPFPCEYSHYSTKTFKNDAHLKKRFHRNFRVIEAEVFLQKFASDRSHMFKLEFNDWLKPPPNYPCIRTPDSSNNLQDFISMDPSVGIGQVMTLQQLGLKFGF